MTTIESALSNIINQYESNCELNGDIFTSALNENSNFDFHSKYQILVYKLAMALIEKNPTKVLHLVQEFSPLADEEIQAMSIYLGNVKESNLIHNYINFTCLAFRSLVVTGNSQYAWFVFQRGKVISRQFGLNFPSTDSRSSVEFKKGMISW